VRVARSAGNRHARKAAKPKSARAVGFVYSWSRFSAIFIGFVIAFVLEHSGVAGAFVFIAAAMLVSLLAVALMGPRTGNLALEQISN
jgi:putative MFS transporter